jgi:hypothetical protein
MQAAVSRNMSLDKQRAALGADTECKLAWSHGLGSAMSGLLSITLT